MSSTTWPLVNEVWDPAYAKGTHHLRMYWRNCDASSRMARHARSTYAEAGMGYQFQE